MKEFFLNVLIIAYATVGAINIIAYFPTIKDLYHHKKASANVLSFTIWTGAAVITFLYSLFILPDILFIIVSGINLAADITVLTLSIILKHSK
jgi:hypothetical protein